MSKISGILKLLKLEMSDDRKKVYSKRGTGTVPKIKCHSNTSLRKQDEPNLVPNNLGRDFNQPNRIRHFRNSEKYQSGHQYFGMEQLIDEQSVPNKNGIPLSSNGVLSQNVGDSISRRNSSEAIPKCDNMTKYPDKKQIEDKLNQIREYLHITASLMTNTKNSCDQINEIPKEQLEKIFNDLKDSEIKLIAILSDIDACNKNVIDETKNMKVFENGCDNLSETTRFPKKALEKKLEHANRQLEILREQENLLMTLQVKAENQLREARQTQQTLISQQNNSIHYIDEIFEHNSNEVNDASFNMGTKKENQEVLKDLEEHRGLKIDSGVSRNSMINMHEQFQEQVDTIQQKINQLKDSNDNRNQLIQFLDKHDAQLQSEHIELQGKLWELQNKKMQVDQLVSQLQSMNEEYEEDDIGFQVRKIVSMKEQLSKLKDMLEIVKNSENVFESQKVNEVDSEVLDLTNFPPAKSDNIIQNAVKGNHFVNQEGTSSTFLEGYPVRIPNEQKIKEKHVNKKSMNANEKERTKLQADLHAKKRELEELMCKHKATSSNLNQDVRCENKSDIGTSNHSLYEGTPNSWCPVPSNLYHLTNSSERCSSDGCVEDDINEYSELNSSGEANNIQMVQPMTPLNYLTSNYAKRKSAEPCLEVPEPYTRTSSHTPDHSVSLSTSNVSRLQREPARSNSERDTQNKTQVQKQLELIRNVCDSMLEQQNLIKEQSVPSHNVRNNFTPSPQCSETRQFTSPNINSMNTLNVMHAVPDVTWVPSSQNHSNITLNDPSGYQNWLTTNSLQTQAFMLNTLNQCCQMLWLQQKELLSLRNTITMMQEKLQIFDQNNSVPLYMNTNAYMHPLIITPSESRDVSQMRTGLINSKMNQVSSATSLPNLNHSHVTHSTNTFDSAYGTNHNNLHSTRIFESGLNNTIHQNSVSSHLNNSLLQDVNQPLPSQMWNGQALNNQVAPGNRANNYWDNFRSYSRQNLLSTKSNEGLQNHSSASERPNNSSERSQNHTYSHFGTQKRNPTHQEPLNSATGNRRKAIFKSSQHSHNSEQIATIPSDILNINEIHMSQKSNDNNDLLEIPIGYEPFENTFEHVDASANNLNMSRCHTRSQRNLNEWHNDTNADTNAQSKSKLFDELRENVYREVASLISANQGRPHFLIQLFRDLQMVSSDPLRRRTLQSIQSLISHSLSGSTQDTFRHENDSGLDVDCQDYLSEVNTFLNAHSEHVLQQNLLETLKELLVDCTFSSVSINNTNKDNIIQKHFSNLATEAFEQYKGKRIKDVKMNIFQTIDELLKGEISLIKLMRENTEEVNVSLIMNDANIPQTNQTILDFSQQIQGSLGVPEDYNNPPQIQNEDLAEADQSRLEVEDEEEGAVGGVLNIIDECSSNSNAEQIDIEFSEQGLDQVPTRLTTHLRSQLNTPVKDFSNSSRTDVLEQF